ncbi:MAG: hypothetical protein AB7F64_02810 [Gammaproteobacteria bacterium]
MWPLYFHRTYYNNGEKQSFFDFLQQFIHVSDIYWIEAKNAYCRINECGDLEEKVFIQNEPDFTIILVEKELLNIYLNYSKQFLARFFEIESNNWNNLTQYLPKNQNHKINVINNGLTKGADLIQARSITKKKEKYERFKIYDLKHDKIKNCSCDPKLLDDHYKDTGKPLEMSPVFFNAEVLSLYKHNPDKYEITPTSISCKGSWSLKTYDINKEGQVYTFIYYLGNLPHKEQLHWSRYNEDKKGPISERSIITNFQGKPYRTTCPLELLKISLQNFPTLNENGKQIDIWKPKVPIKKLFNKIHLIHTENNQDYRDFILNLCILVIDGLNLKTLKCSIKDLLIDSDKISSLTALEKLLEKWKITNIKKIMNPFRELQEQRSKYAAHSCEVINFNIKTESLRLASELYTSLETLIQIIRDKN